MADDKRTKIGGQAAPLPTPAPQSAHYTPAPVGYTPAPGYTPSPQSGQPTSILPDHGAHAHAHAPVAGPNHATSYLPPQVDPMVGATLAGRYHIIKKLGEGGMGAVYLATHNLLEKQVALKVLHGEFARKADLVERFMQEAKSASRIRHENVIDISDFGTTPEGMVFFAMELLKGHDLHEEIARARLAGQLLPWHRSKRIFLQICAALTAAHSHGIIHRDLKPENVYLVEFLGEPDFVKLLDFGIAKLTEVDEGGRKLTKTGMLFGTPEYMSPEQARGEQVDHRVDVYAMGCILFQLVTGRVPFEADNFMGVLSLHLTEPPPSIPPEVFDRIGAPRELAAVIDRALMKERNVRWGSIEELANAVRIACGDPLPSASIAMQKAAAIVPAGPGAKTAGVTGGVAVPASTTQSRQKTQWTGNLSVPQEEDRPTGKSKIPLIIGLLLVLGGGATAAFFVMNSKKGGDENGSNGSNGSAVVQNPPNGNGTGTNGAITPPPPPPQAIDAGVAQPPPPTIDAGAVLPPPPAMITFKIDSTPKGAEVTNMATGKKYGVTPVTLNIKGSHDTLSFQIHKNGYGDTIIDVTPDADGGFVAKLEKGESSTPTRQTVVLKPGDPVTKPDGGGAVVKPDGGNTTKLKPDAGVAKPPPEDECVDMPCVKTNVPGLKNGSGSGS